MKLKILRIMAIITGLIGTTLFNRFMEGGALFMSFVLICLIISFDVLEATGEANPSVIAGGLKVALLSTLFGLFTYSVSKFSILILRIVQK